MVMKPEFQQKAANRKLIDGFEKQGPQPADPGLVLGAPAEVTAAVCRSACLQVFGIAGLEFVCVFGYHALQGMRHADREHERGQERDFGPSR